jgi:glycosyltransferase involved in cell wall biosynthesis
MTNIKFSIVVPVYNIVYIQGENMLKKCIESLVSQVYQNIEIILVNDGSTDDAPIVCEQYAIDDTRIVVIHKENEGAGEARNVGIKKATGDFVLFVDSDDTIQRESTQVFYDILMRRPDVDIIASDYRCIKNHLISYKRFTPLTSDTPITGIDFLKYQIRSYTRRTGTGYHIVRLALIKKHDIYFDKNMPIAEDLVWGPNLYMFASSVVLSHFAHYNYYIGHISRGAPQNPAQKYEPLIKLCHQLEARYDSITDPELRILLKDYLVQLYFLAFRMGRYYKKEYRHLVDKEFAKRNSYLKKTKIAVSLFCLSPWLFCTLFYLRARVSEIF